MQASRQRGLPRWEDLALLTNGVGGNDWGSGRDGDVWLKDLYLRGVGQLHAWMMARQENLLQIDDDFELWERLLIQSRFSLERVGLWVDL